MEHPMKDLVQAALSATALTALVATIAVAQERMVDINKLSEAGVGDKIGTIRVTEAKNGTTFKIDVTGITAGKHGFHLHENGDCAAAAKDGKMEAGGAAGGHYDPASTKSHKGPKGASGTGHKGDLPVLTATAKGIKQSVTAGKLKLVDVEGRALVIHEGGDNYTDQPANGGGGARIACGVIPKT
jgi:Cu-Zn family superoxide dismutase